MDLATIIGILLGWGAVIGSGLMEGGNLGALLNVPALFLIFGGTLGATIVSFPLGVMMQLPQYTMKAFVAPPVDIAGQARQLVEMSRKARREGLLLLEEDIAATDDTFLKKGLQLLVDGAEPEVVRSMLETELAFWEQKEKVGEALFSSMGGYAPTIGIIGTVLGLIHALGRMEDPKKMGAAIGGAFLATFYGVSFANLLFLPLAGKLKCRVEEKIVVYEMTLEGLLAIQAGENPRTIEDRLMTFVPEGQRSQLVAANAMAEAGAS